MLSPELEELRTLPDHHAEDPPGTLKIVKDFVKLRRNF